MSGSRPGFHDMTFPSLGEIELLDPGCCAVRFRSELRLELTEFYHSYLKS